MFLEVSALLLNEISISWWPFIGAMAFAVSQRRTCQV
jgi:hypothetical protein